MTHLPERELQTLRLQLSGVLALIEANDLNYDRRYVLVLRALAITAALDYPCGIALDPAEPEWPVVYIDLPTGQVSWHMPAYGGVFDGHTTAEKYARCFAYGATVVHDGGV